MSLTMCTELSGLHIDLVLWRFCAWIYLADRNVQDHINDPAMLIGPVQVTKYRKLLSCLDNNAYWTFSNAVQK